jgi:hypothetical protein
MPRLSLYHPQKTQDYTFFDRLISEQLTVGGTDLYIHKFIGPTNQGPSNDYTQPQYDTPNPKNIQDLLFLENRDRAYDTNIYRLRGHYQVQNLDFDLSQFGLFLNNNIIFIVVHYNDMIEQVGRKLMVGDVIELPHLLDYDPLDSAAVPVALKRFMQITDANWASEGFSPTWYPHLWRIKCEPLVNSEEFNQILSQPTNTDNYLGPFDPAKPYPQGYVVTYGGVNYISTQPVPPGITPPNATYWRVDTDPTLNTVLSTYNTNISINNAVLEEAQRIVPKSGYTVNNMYVVPTYGDFVTDVDGNTVLSEKNGQPAPPVDVIVYTGQGSQPAGAVLGKIQMINNPKYKFASPVVRISKQALDDLRKNNANIKKFTTAHLQLRTIAPDKIGSGSGFVSGHKLLEFTASPIVITGPYGTADNTYATADQDPVAPGFTGTVSQQMDFRADCDPRFQYISRYSPQSFGYLAGYLTGDGQAPNGFPVNGNMAMAARLGGAGISFPSNPAVGDYFLRIDYLPQVLYRWDGLLWLRISESVRTDTGFTASDQSLLSGFINDSNVTVLTSGVTVPESQPLSTILNQPYPPLPPIID